MVVVVVVAACISERIARHVQNRLVEDVLCLIRTKTVTRISPLSL